MRHKGIVLSAAILAAAAGFSRADAQDSARPALTTIDLTTCTVLRRHADGNSWRCRGMAGYPVYVAEGDLRMFISVGKDAEQRRAAQQTLRSFNTLFPGKASRATIEWRVLPGARTRAPYATIVRFHTATDTGKGQVLVVSKVSPTETCQMAIIDALANPNAIALARTLADTRARTFDCKTDPSVEGAVGKSPM